MIIVNIAVIRGKKYVWGGHFKSIYIPNTVMKQKYRNTEIERSIEYHFMAWRPDKLLVHGIIPAWCYIFLL